MSDNEPGHLFVVHGDLTQIEFDAVAIPSDIRWDVRPHWAQYVPARGTEPGWAHGRVSHPARVGSVTVRYVDSGFTPQDADPAELGRRVEAGLRALAGDLDVRAMSGGTRVGRPVIGMPLFGVGEGGFAGRRGAALGDVSQRAGAVAASTGVDIAIVCGNRSDYAALQRQAGGRGWAGLTDGERTDADRLGTRAREGSLALFLGAGVSMAVGLPSYAGLLRDLGADDEMLTHQPAEAAQLLLASVSEASVRRDLVAILQRYPHSSLQHALLASLKVEDVVTTNFDDLYERAAGPVFGGDLAVLPWSPPDGRAPYLLKLHGDPLMDASFVLSADHFRTFATVHGAEQSVLQALTLIGRELLFVGYSLRDPNVRAVLADTAARTTRLGATAPRMATVLDVAPPSGEPIARVERLSLQRDDENDVASRRLEVFLDRVAWSAAAEEASWLLDERYADLVDSGDTAVIDTLRTMTVPAGSHWSGLRRLLRTLGTDR